MMSANFPGFRSIRDVVWLRRLFCLGLLVICTYRFFEWQQAVVLAPYQPIALPGGLYIPYLDGPVYKGLTGSLALALLGSIFGFAARVCLVVAALLFLIWDGFLQGLMHGLGQPLLISPTWFIVSSLILMSISPGMGHQKASGGFVPGWAPAFVLTMVGLTYLAAAISVLRLTGITWLSGEPIKAALWHSYLLSGAEGAQLALNAPAWFFPLAAIAILGFQLGFVSVLFVRRQWIWCLAGLLFHVMVWKVFQAPHTALMCLGYLGCLGSFASSSKRRSRRY